jgi:hypothetical protein
MRDHGSDVGQGISRRWRNGAITLWEVGVVMPQIMALRTAQLAAHLSASAGAPAVRQAAATLAGWQSLATQGLQVQQHLAEQALAQCRQTWLAALSSASAQRHAFRATVVPVAGARARPAAEERARTVSGDVLPPEPGATNVRRLVTRKSVP